MLVHVKNITEVVHLPLRTSKKTNELKYYFQHLSESSSTEAKKPPQNLSVMSVNIWNLICINIYKR